MAAASNGINTNGVARLLARLAEIENDAAHLRRALELLGVRPPAPGAAAQARVGQVLAEASNLDQQRTGKRRRRFNATPEQQAARHGIIRQMLTKTPLISSGTIHKQLHATGDKISQSRVSQILVDMGDVQGVGPLQQRRYRLKVTAKAPAPVVARPAVKKKKPGPWARQHPGPRGTKSPGNAKHPANRASASFDGTTAEKARTIIGIVRDAPGGLITLEDLVAKAREAGVTSMTGSVNYIRQGYLRRTRMAGSGKTAYRFLRMPPGPPPAPEPQAEEAPRGDDLGTVATVENIDLLEG
jgi:hypothetical protein